MSILFTPSSPMIVDDNIISSISDLSPLPIFAQFEQEKPVNKYTSFSSFSTLSPLSPLSPLSQFSPLGPMSPITVNLDYSKPLVSFYETVDPYYVKQMTNHYYFKVLDKWLLDDLSDILNFFIYKDGKVQLIKSLDDYKLTNINLDNDEIANKKRDYIQDHVFTKYDMLDVLMKFTKDTHSKFVDLPKNEFFLKQAVKEYLIKDIKKKISK